MGAELDKELVHLAEVSCVAMGVEQGETSGGVFDVEGDDVLATFGVEAHDINIVLEGDIGERQSSGARVLDDAVRRRGRWEEGKLGSYGGGESTHGRGGRERGCAQKP